MEKIIFHVDVNNAFLSWEAVDRLKKGKQEDIRLIASVIGGDPLLRHGIVLAKSNVSKKYNIKTAETLYSAKRKCPKLKVYSPNYDLYSCESKKLYNLLLNYSPDVYQYSIDECFFDYTGMESLFGNPLDFASKLKNEIKDKFGWTVNIGIGNNIVCAKMASDFLKPDKVHTLYRNEIKDKLWPLDISNLFMVGKKTVIKLREMGIYKISDLACYNKNKLIKMFNKHAITMYNHAWGISSDSIDELKKESENRSISMTTTLIEDTNNINDIKKILLNLANDIAFKIRVDKVYAYSIGIILKDYKFVTTSRQTKLKNGVNTAEEIYKEACRLLDIYYQSEYIRLVGIKVFDFHDDRNIQLSLFEEASSIENNEKINKTMDKIKEKYGKDSIQYAYIKDNK